jgi:hypothetical protein
MTMKLFRTGAGAGPLPSLSLCSIALILVGTSELIIPQISLAAPQRSSNQRIQLRAPQHGGGGNSSNNSSSNSGSPSSGSSTTPPATTPPATTPSATTNPGGFTLSGLLSPATVADSVFVYSNGVPSNASVSYFVDNVLQSTETASPFWMGGVASSAPKGFSINGLSAGEHNLRATAALADGSTISSNTIILNVVPSINSQFSQALTPYANQPSAQQTTVSQVSSLVGNAKASLSATENTTRQNVIAMYLNWGIDVSLDSSNDQSSVLRNLEPKSWQAPTAPASANSPISMAFSPDAPFYHAIPAAWPKVELPSGYIQQLQMSSAYGGDGIGFGVTMAASSDPQLTVTSQWYSDKNTLETFPFRMKQNWSSSLPTNTGGDQHMIFVDPVTNTFASTYATTLNKQTGGPNTLYAPSPTSFNSLGDFGGSAAAHFAEVPVMIQPGEATNANQPIRHAIGGPVERTWAARVFPAIARDSGVTTGENTCNGSGPMNTGLVPYGGVIQLDPKLDLTKLSLSLPALRILQAMQTYGYYVMDFGCGDMDIYSSMSASEVDAYGGMYGNVKGPGIQNEIQKIISTSQLYVVAPLTKKQ